MTTEIQGAWQRFLATYEPLRAELYRYCRYLTRSPWDAEDLTQDTLARGFATLAKRGEAPPNPRAWLFRVASNLWIDQARRRREVLVDAPDAGIERGSPRGEPSSQGPGDPCVAADRPRSIVLGSPIAITRGDHGAPDAATTHEPRGPREAAGTLLVKLSPQERAAVVLKDVFELSLDEIAEALDTSVGAVKTALHRGRGKLVDDEEPDSSSVPAPGALDAFVAAFNAGDLDRLTALLLDRAVVEVVGATEQHGPEAARRTVLTGMLFGHLRMLDGRAPIDARLVAGITAEPPRLEARWHRDRWILVHWYQHDDGPAVRAITMLELDGDRVARLANHFYDPDFLADLGGELGVPTRSNGYRW